MAFRRKNLWLQRMKGKTETNINKKNIESRSSESAGEPLKPLEGTVKEVTQIDSILTSNNWQTK